MSIASWIWDKLSGKQVNETTRAIAVGMYCPVCNGEMLRISGSSIACECEKPDHKYETWLGSKDWTHHYMYARNKTVYRIVFHDGPPATVHFGRCMTPINPNCQRDWSFDGSWISSWMGPAQHINFDPKNAESIIQLIDLMEVLGE